MSRPITQPINQVRLTNVAVVRMNKSGKRFEIACYRNKVVNYRQGLETDLSEVLQTERVFTNVSKGQFAKLTDVEAVFGTRNEVDVCRIILEKGMVQVGDLERAEQLESVQRDIATWIANHCVHSKTQRPYTMSQIRQAMHESNFVVHNPATRPLKRQYLDCIKSLQTVLGELERAKMELALIVPLRHVRKLQQQVNEEWGLSMTTTTTTTSQSTSPSVDDDDDHDSSTTSTSTSTSTSTFTLLVDPSMYRQLDELCKSMDGCQLQIIQQVVMNQDDVNLETEVEQHQQRQALLELESLSLSSSSAAVPSPPAARNTSDVQAHDSVTSSKDDTQLQQGLQSKDHDNDHHEHDDDDDDDDEESSSESDKEDAVVPQTKKSQRQNNKKSKKAKRREKEDLLERQARMEAERQRREEREQHLQEQQEPSSSHYYYNTTTGGSNVGATAGSASASAASAKSCNTCGGTFATAADYRAHFKSDWHRFNQKLKLQGKMAISEQEFLLCDADML